MQKIIEALTLAKTELRHLYKHTKVDSSNVLKAVDEALIEAESNEFIFNKRHIISFAKFVWYTKDFKDYSKGLLDYFKEWDELEDKDIDYSKYERTKSMHTGMITSNPQYITIHKCEEEPSQSFFGKNWGKDDDYDSPVIKHFQD